MSAEAVHRSLRWYNLALLKRAGIHPFRALTFMNISAGYLTLQIFRRLRAKVYKRSWSILGILRQDGHSVIRLSHLVVARRLLRLVGTLISLSPPVSITLFQVSYWSTSGQKSYVYFLFFLTANFWWKIEFDAQGQDGKLGKIAYFPPFNLLLLFVMNGKIRYLWEMLFCAGQQASQFRTHQFMFTVREWIMVECVWMQNMHVSLTGLSWEYHPPRLQIKLLWRDQVLSHLLLTTAHVQWLICSDLATWHRICNTKLLEISGNVSFKAKSVACSKRKPHRLNHKSTHY